MAKTEDELSYVSRVSFPIIKKYNVFFGVKPKIRIQVIYSKEQFEFYKGFFQDWMVGTASKQNLWILSKNVIENLTIHKKECFNKVLAHELAHIYVNAISPFVPIWLNEGIAVYMSENLLKRKEKIKQKEIKILNLFNKDNNQKEMQLKNYIIAPCFVEYLIKKHSKNKFMDFLKKFKPELDINKISKDCFGNTISKEFKNWKYFSM